MKCFRFALVLALGAGCASTPPPPPPPPPAPAAAEPPQQKSPEEEMEIWGSGVLGTLTDDQMQAPIEMRWNDIIACKDQARPKPPRYVGGKVVLRFRIARDGRVKQVFVEESTLGNFTTEHCILEIARGMQFSRPKGGEAEFSFPVEYPAKGRVDEWPEERVAGDFARRKAELKSCEDGVARQPPHKVTLYIGAGGQVTSIGASSSEPIGEPFVRCLVQKVQGWRFPDPLGVAVRTSHAFR